MLWWLSTTSARSVREELPFMPIGMILILWSFVNYYYLILLMTGTSCNCTYCTSWYYFCWCQLIPGWSSECINCMSYVLLLALAESKYSSITEQLHIWYCKCSSYHIIYPWCAPIFQKKQAVLEFFLASILYCLNLPKLPKCIVIGSLVLLSCMVWVISVCSRMKINTLEWFCNIQYSNGISFDIKYWQAMLCSFG